MESPAREQLALGMGMRSFKANSTRGLEQFPAIVLVRGD